ncbi:ExbD/TolR family protein [Candidatus Endoriftia persephonae]|jgi:biopolymer transport protein ExbD|uniref:Biopolymer transport protein ExbD/TolR n=2 Tax=Gammaproteobacteria TaxID=1236 RepID=G2FH98_9GAMM|nr:biopolymer transporter ExbD [Candidatus Endoriftia persephone]EGW53772.1 biopolymer transport protein ExbD/TolR [endosymbiont of Tevnia jerichonana (vent Tica)]USF88483.1 biopolymer transporter ExbD [Candidatus Endoriftia persephone]
MRRRSRRLHEEAELNITAFMNLMVILVPFLLITASFSRMAVFDLYLPPAAAGGEPAKGELQLEIIVRHDAIEVADRNGGLIQRIEADDPDRQLQRLSQLLQALKARYPDKRTAYLLAEPQVAYDTLVQVMDRVRVAELVQTGSLVQAELFPDISLGDAPPLPESAGQGERS